jgi:hypothetical protein
VNRVLPAEPAILVHLKLVRGVFLVLDCIVVALFTVVAPQGYFNSHNGTSILFFDLVASLFLTFGICPQKQSLSDDR